MIGGWGVPMCEGGGLVGWAVVAPIPDAEPFPPPSLQICNGLAQTTGWPSVVACVGNWFGKGK